MSEGTDGVRAIRYIVNGDQLRSMSLSHLNLPPEVCNGFWSLNTHNQRLSTPSDTLLMSFCPELIGPCCTPVRRRDFCKLLMSFTFWLIVAQTIVVGLSLKESKSPLEKVAIEPAILAKYGAMVPERLRNNNEYWRLFSCVFVHATVSHFLVCIIAEFMFLLSREAAWNTLRFIPVFMLSSVCGSFFLLVVSPNTSSVGSGSSIFGAFGAFIVSYAVIFDSLQWKHRVSVLFLILMNVIFLIFVVNERQEETWAFLGSLCFGVSFGLILFSHKNQHRRGRIVGYVLGTIFSVGLLTVPITWYSVQVYQMKHR